ncbi:hypothetical protein MRX96_007036 [Rhipicephalus microplus]
MSRINDLSGLRAGPPGNDFGRLPRLLVTKINFDSRGSSRRVDPLASSVRWLACGCHLLVDREVFKGVFCRCCRRPTPWRLALHFGRLLRKPTLWRQL